MSKQTTQVGVKPAGPNLFSLLDPYKGLIALRILLALASNGLSLWLPSSTTGVIIVHRLNTIANADEIFFINSGTLTPAGSVEHTVDLLLHGKRESSEACMGYTIVV